MADVTILDLPLQTVFDETDYLHIINNLTSVDNRTTILSLSRWILEDSNSDKLTVDLTNTRVGINVAAPVTTLEMQATVVNSNHFIMRHLNGNIAFSAGDDSGQDSFIDVRDVSGASKARIHSDGTSFFDGGSVGIGTITVPPSKLYVYDDSAAYAGRFDNINSLGAGLEIRAGSTSSTFAFRVADYANNELLRTRGDGATTFLGQIGINTAGSIPTMASAADDLIVGDGTQNRGITIYSSSDATSSLYFADSNSSPGWNDGFISFTHSSQTMQFGTDATVKVEIDSSGNVKFSNYSEGTLVTDSSGNITVGPGLPLESGTVALFGQATSPTGWTKLLAWADDSMLTINTQTDGTALGSGGVGNPQNGHIHGNGSLFAAWKEIGGSTDSVYKSVNTTSWTYNTVLSDCHIAVINVDSVVTAGVDVLGVTEANSIPLYQEVIAVTKD